MSFGFGAQMDPCFNVYSGITVWNYATVMLYAVESRSMILTSSTAFEIRNYKNDVDHNYNTNNNNNIMDMWVLMGVVHNMFTSCYDEIE